ncbi:MAG: 3-oxoadipate enol-lactonase [Actinomycetia bacterium]|nr:3-oxoadipate enol-lactonase [Actinomycetes bacterium]
MERIAVGGVELQAELSGPEGAPYLTFSHSLGADLTMWDPQVAAFADSYRILRYDTRGHGRSSVPSAPYSFADLTGDVVGLLDTFGIERTHFAGLSLGGMTALGLALAHADRLESITVANAVASMPAEVLPMWDERVSVARDQGMQPLVESTIERWFTEPMRERGEPVLDRVRALIAKTPVEGYAGCIAAIKAIAYEPHLGEIAVPALFIAGEADTGTPPGPMHAMHECVPGSRYVELKTAHLSNLEQPQAFSEALREFLPV